MLASLVAGLATTLFAAYHFHRLAPYGVLANLLAMPIVSLLVMPSGLLALLALPFGLDGPLWRLMGLGIDWMIAVALWVASLPGSVGRIAAFGIGPLLLATRRAARDLPAQDAAALVRRGAGAAPRSCGRPGAAGPTSWWPTAARRRGAHARTAASPS